MTTARSIPWVNRVKRAPEEAETPRPAVLYWRIDGSVISAALQKFAHVPEPGPRRSDPRPRPAARPTFMPARVVYAGEGRATALNGWDGRQVPVVEAAAREVDHCREPVPRPSTRCGAHCGGWLWPHRCLSLASS